MPSPARGLKFTWQLDPSPCVSSVPGAGLPEHYHWAHLLQTWVGTDGVGEPSYLAAVLAVPCVLVVLWPGDAGGGPHTQPWSPASQSAPPPEATLHFRASWVQLLPRSGPPRFSCCLVPGWLQAQVSASSQGGCLLSIAVLAASSELLCQGLPLFWPSRGTHGFLIPRPTHWPLPLLWVCPLPPQAQQNFIQCIPCGLKTWGKEMSPTGVLHGERRLS